VEDREARGEEVDVEGGDIVEAWPEADVAGQHGSREIDIRRGVQPRVRPSERVVFQLHENQKFECENTAQQDE